MTESQQRGFSRRAKREGGRKGAEDGAEQVGD